MLLLRRVSILLLAAASSLTVTQADPPRYHLTIIPATTSYCAAVSINDNGDVAGDLSTTNSLGQYEGHAFTYINGRFSDLGTYRQRSTFVNAISNEGVIVGESYNQSSSGMYGYTNSGNGFVDLPFSVDSDSITWDINRNGDVLGEELTYYDQTFVLHTDGTMSFFFGFEGRAMNDVGSIVGTRNEHGIFYKDRTAYEIGWVPPGALRVEPTAINNHDQVVGHYARNNYEDRQAFYWENGVAHNLETSAEPRSDALDINDNGEIVGWRYPYWGSDRYGFVRKDGVFYDMNEVSENSTFQRILTATSINANGWITGYGRRWDGSFASYVAVPSPEPAVFAPLAPAFGLFALRRKRR